MAERKSFLLRISPELWADLESWAGDDLRSVNGQIEFLLREAVQRRRRSGGGKGRASAPAPSGPPPAPSAPSAPLGDTAGGGS